MNFNVNTLDSNTVRVQFTLADCSFSGVIGTRAGSETPADTNGKKYMAISQISVVTLRRRIPNIANATQTDAILCDGLDWSWTANVHGSSDPHMIAIAELFQN